MNPHPLPAAGGGGRLRRNILLDQLLRFGIRFLPLADAGRDWLLGGRTLLLVALRRGFDGNGGFQCFDPLGQFGNGRAVLFATIMLRGGQAGLELVPQAGQFSQVGIACEWLAQAFPVAPRLAFRPPPSIAPAFPSEAQGAGTDAAA